jgi:hypothetical protein
MNSSSPQDRSALLSYTPREKNRILDLITTEAGSVADEQEVKGVLRAHRDHFLRHRVEVFESEVAQIAARMGAGSTLVDVGCWTGVLGRLVLERVRPAGYLGIDAGRWYVDIAREVLPEWCRFRSFYIVPDSAVDLARIDKIYFTLEDPLNTSGFYTRRVWPQDKLAAMPVGKTMRPIDFAHYLRHNLDLEHLYLKTDIEGVDQELVQALIRDGTLPQVLHFEMLEKFMPYWPQTREALQRAYDFVDLPGEPDTTAIVVAVRKGEPLRPATIVWNKSTRALTTLE